MRTLSSILRYQIRSGGPTPFRVLTRNMHHREEISWKKPEKGWIKLNFDGSCKCKTGKGSIGGIFRNHNAEFVLGYAESLIGKTNSSIAEFTALQRGLELVVENGWTDVWLEGDYKSLVEIIEQKRQGNRAADQFAKMGHLMKTPQIWHRVPPNQVVRFVNEDARGKIFLRRR